MRRRKFIALLGGAAAWPLAARAQPPTMPTIGFLSSTSPAAFTDFLAAFRKGLREIGLVEGENVLIEFQWAHGRYERLPALAAELASREVALIAATGGDASALAAKTVTSTIPIVFTIGGDPVKLGLVASFNQPGGNLTGITLLGGSLDEKRVGLLYELVPRVAVIATVVNPNSPLADAQAKGVQTAARAIGLEVIVLHAGNEQEIDAAFANLAAQGARALVVVADPFLFLRRNQIVALAAHHKVPAIYEVRDFASAGGLISYGTRIASMYLHAGRYAGRILKGAKPAELPVMQPTSFELVINLKAAKALGIEIPPTLLAQADEVIE
jgi:putative ABC transport system substrate-binding protein